jgi:chromosomal replication initiator protein
MGGNFVNYHPTQPRSPHRSTITAPGLPHRSQEALSAGSADAPQSSRHDRTFSRQYSFEQGAAELAIDRHLEKPAERQTEETSAKAADLLLAQTPDAYEDEALNGKEFDPHAVWQMLLSELALQMPSATYSTWVRDTWVIAYEDGEFIIGLPNAYARDWLENRLRHKIKRVLGTLIHRSVQVQFRVCPRTVSDSPNAAPTPLYQPEENEPPAYINSRTERTLSGREQAPPAAAATHSNQGQGRAQETVVVARSQLNSYYTFETFVVGSHNKLAHAAAEAIAERPGQSFNPLFVYGGVGLGKTHLLHAIGQRALQMGYRMLYCSSEQFTNDLIGAIRNQNTDEFRNKYRQVDILLIDDIQFIAGKESTQEEFFHTFNYLHAGGRQVVLSSDRPPKALATLDDRLRSRFEGGLQTDISQPDFETRVAILQCKAKRMNATIDSSVLMMIAERVDSNIRELEGALNRLTIQARLVNSPLNLALATAIIDNLAPERTPCAPDGLVRLVAAHFHLKVDDLTGRKRTKEIAYARQIAMFLLREEHALSLPAIGDQLGGRDHSTVRYGIEKVAADLNEDEALRQAITILREKIYVPFAV